MGKIESSYITASTCWIFQYIHFFLNLYLILNFQVSMATDIMFPEWKIWTQFLLKTNDGLRMDALEQSHPIEVRK